VDVGNIFDHRGSCISINSVKSGDDCFNLFLNIGTGLILIRIRLIWHTWLVKVMIAGLVISKSKEVGVNYGSLYALE